MTGSRDRKKEIQVESPSGTLPYPFGFSDTAMEACLDNAFDFANKWSFGCYVLGTGSLHLRFTWRSLFATDMGRESPCCHRAVRL